MSKTDRLEKVIDEFGGDQVKAGKWFRDNPLMLELLLGILTRDDTKIDEYEGDPEEEGNPALKFMKFKKGLFRRR